MQEEAESNLFTFGQVKDEMRRCSCRVGDGLIERGNFLRFDGVSESDEGATNLLGFGARPLAHGLCECYFSNGLMTFFDIVRNNAQSESFGVGLGLFLGAAVGHDAWELRNVRYPAAIFFAGVLNKESHSTLVTSEDYI